MARRPGRGLELHRAALVCRAQSLAAHPGRLGLASALAMAVYLGGVLVLRRLLALPTQRVAHAERVAGARGVRASRAGRPPPRVRRAARRPGPAPAPSSWCTASGRSSRDVSGPAAVPATAPRHRIARRPSPPPPARRAGGLARRPQQARPRRWEAPHRAAAPRGRRCARDRPRRDGTPGRLQHRVQRKRARPPARGAGHRGRLRQAAGQSGHRRRRRRAASGRRRSGDILTLGGEVRDKGGEIGGEVRTFRLQTWC